MAIEATPMEVWIEWRTRPRAAVVVPYVRAQDKASIDYQVFIRREGSAESTQVRQTGDAHLQGHIPRPLGEVLISREPGDKCTVFVRIAERLERGEAKPVERNFDCPLAR
jgi:hypothetical protein